MKKALSVVLCLVLVLAVLPVFVQADTGTPFTIGNPYENVDWDTWYQFKAQLHVHTDASDGAVPKNEVIEIHYELGYDILAITDHMTTGVRWDEIPRTVPLMRLLELDRTGFRPITPLTTERREEIITGVGRYRPDGSPQPMLEVTQGNELNGAVFRQNHVQGFFTDYGQGRLGVTLDFIRPMRGVDRTGGISVINHPGDVHRATRDADPMTFFDRYPNWVDKFAYPLLRFQGSAAGIDINSGWGNHTRYDRILYDRLLERLIPHGVVPWSFTWSDGHSHGEFDRAWTMHLMTELTTAELRRSMEEGTFFGFSRQPQQELGDNYWRGEGPAPVVNRITVCEENGTIEINADLYTEIRWVSHRTRAAHTGNTLDIVEHLNDDEFFVRAYVLGPGGVLYVQPFTVLRQGQTLPAAERIRNPFDYSVPLRWVADFADVWARIFPISNAMWGWLTRFDPQLDAPWLFNIISGWFNSQPTEPCPCHDNA